MKRKIKLYPINNDMFVCPTINFYVIYDPVTEMFVGPARDIRNPTNRSVYGPRAFIKSNLYKFPPKFYQHVPSIWWYYDGFRDQNGQLQASKDRLVVLRSGIQNNFFVEYKVQTNLML